MEAMYAEMRQLRQQQQAPVVVTPVAVAPAPPVVPAVVPEVRLAPEAGGQRLEPMYERFRKQSPPTFEGGPDPTKAEQWMSMIKIVLDFMDIVGHDRVKCATYMFREDARTWWEVISQTREVTTLSGDEFVELFNEKYYNEAVRQAKAEEFTSLTQGDLSVTESTLKFDRLSNFAHNLVPTDAMRRERFVAGLKARIAHDVSITLPQRTSTYAQVVERALIAERSGARIRKEEAASRDARRNAPPITGSGKGAGPGDSKRKSFDLG